MYPISFSRAAFSAAVHIGRYAASLVGLGARIGLWIGEDGAGGEVTR